MSIELIKNKIFDFLLSDEAEVMAIKGEWGVGKTFSWNMFLQDARDENKIKLKHYSYVSLFGINSLNDLKYSIFENIINKEIIGTEPSIETFKKNTSSLIESVGRLIFQFFERCSCY